MTDIQILTIAIAIIFPVAALLYSNSRVSDVRNSVGEAKETLRAEIGELRVEMRAGFDRIETAMKGMESRLETKLQIHELEHHRK
jgi:hypothetical protein